MVTVDWRPTLKDGTLGAVIPTTLPDAEFAELAALRRLQGDRATREIRTRMDLFCLFPGITLADPPAVRGTRSFVIDRILDEAHAY